MCPPNEMQISYRHGSAMRARLPKEYPEPCTNVPPGRQSADSQPLMPVGLVVLPSCSPVRLLCFPMCLPGGTLTLCRLLRVITGLPHGVLRMVRHSLSVALAVREDNPTGIRT